MSQILLTNSNKFLNFFIKKLPSYIIFLLFIIWPFLVIKKNFIIYSLDNNYLPSGEYANFFTYYRLIFMLTATLLLLIVFIIYKIIINKKYRLTYTNAILFCFFFWIMLSSILSGYDEAIFGMYDRTRGLIAYIIGFLFIIFINIFIINRQQKKIIFYGFFICTIILTIFSISQFFGFDPFIKTPLKYLIEVDKGITVSYPQFISFAGLYNKNVLATYQIISLTIFIYLYFIYNNKMQNILFFIMSNLIFFSLISTSTRGSWIPLIIFLILYFFLNKERPYKKLIILIICFIIIFIFMDFYSHHSFLKRLPETLIGTVILLAIINFVFIFLRKIFPNIPMTFLFFFIFTFTVSCIFAFSMIASSINNPKLMRAGSGRIYIFSKVCEIIKKKPVFGTGKEALLYNIDIEDINRYKYLKTEYIDKAHSYYLGLASEAGIPALLLFIVLCSIVLSSLFKYNYNKNAALIFWGLIVYLIQALSFDAFICTDILFYTLLGMGINYSNKKII